MRRGEAHRARASEAGVNDGRFGVGVAVVVARRDLPGPDLLRQEIHVRRPCAAAQATG